MSLQGSIETFAIADVLRLLAATSKSGRLHVQGPARAGTVWVDSARVLAAESPSTPHVGGAVDIIFQLLRFERGSFRFELDKYPPNPGDPLDIELALGEAESMLREWRELEQQIPAGDSWVQLRTAIDTPSVTLSAEEWITLVAVSGGRTVADIGDALESGELQTARAIARLLDLGLVEVGPRPAAAPSTPMLAAAVAEVVPAPPEPTVIDVPAPPAAPEAKAPETNVPEAKAPEANVPEAKAPEAPTSNGATSLVPPAPPAPPAPPVAPAWTPSDAAPGWAGPADFPTLAPPPAAAPAPPSVDLTRADAGLVAPHAGDTFPTPPETDLDANGTTSFTYPAAEAPSDVFTYPPAPEAPPVWEPTKADATPSNGSGDKGYPPIPPPLPPVYGSGSASPTLPPPPGATSSDNGTAGAPPANGRGATEAPSAKDGGWIGSLSDAIEQADATGDAGSTSLGSATGSDVGTGATLGGGSGTLAPGSFIGAGAVPPPPPAPPAPVGAWASPTSLFENGLPERLAPPPPPPPPPIATALQSMADPAAVVSPTLLGGAATLTEVAAPATETATATATDGADAETAITAADNAEDIERQLFNLSPRAREAVKQSSGLYDGRGRR